MMMMRPVFGFDRFSNSGQNSTPMTWIRVIISNQGNTQIIHMS
jgi:hypothetical protein